MKEITFVHLLTVAPFIFYDVPGHYISWKSPLTSCYDIDVVKFLTFIFFACRQ